MCNPPSKPLRDWSLYLSDMYGFTQNVITYTKDFELNTFVANRIVYDATIRNLELIGESANRVPVEAREKYPQIPWRQLIATRNQLIHGYLGIDDTILWSIIENDIPALLNQLAQIVFDSKY